MNGRVSADALSAFLAPFTPAARSLAQATRDVLLRVFPEAVETAEGKDLGYGIDRGYKGLVFTIGLKNRGVNLGVVNAHCSKIRTSFCKELEKRTATLRFWTRNGSNLPISRCC